MFEGDRLDDLPKQSELHHLADYLELLCLTDVDGEYGVERLAERLHFGDDLQATSADAQDSDEIDVVEQFLDARDNAEIGPEYGSDLEPDSVEEATYEAYGRDAEERDVRNRWCEDLFAYLVHRAEVLGDSYPFTVNNMDRSIRLATVTSERLFYVYLLTCSSLKYVPKRSRGRLTKSFELVSADVLKGVLPEHAVVDVFGTSRGQVKTRFAGSLYVRIGQLAKALGGKRHVSRKDFHPKDTADNGLDIAAWIPMPGGREGQPAFFGQCACGTGWRGKQHEADYLMRWKNYISLTSPPTTLTFIPYFFRKPGGHWYAASDVDTVVIDRLRTMLLASESRVAMERVPFDLARQAWNFRNVREQINS